MIDRREFLQRSLATVAGSSVILRGGLATCGSTSHGSKLPAIGLQLYTVRSEMEKSVEQTLDRVASIGYNEVEFAGYFGRTPQQIADALKKAGLRAPSSHVSLGPNWEKTVADAAAVGHEYLVVPWIDESQRTADGIQRIAEQFNQAAETAKKAGIKFGYHNHDFEFKPLAGGTLFYDTLLAKTDPKLVLMEMDLFWITKGGKDPLEYWKKYPGRFELLHVKDMTTDGTMTEVGSGSIPFAKYFHASDIGGANHFFVEHDQPKVPFESVARSYAYLKRLEF